MPISLGFPTAAHSSSLRDPCPSGTGIGYTTFNGSDTIFVVCDSAFYVNREVDNLALGLGLGLGLPAGILLVRMLYKWLVRREQQQMLTSINVGRTPRAAPQQLLSEAPLVFPAEEVEKHLSPQGLADFRIGNLTEALKEELMITRVRVGQDLMHFVKYADQLHHVELADFIQRMNITAFPPEIHRKAQTFVIAEEP